MKKSLYTETESYTVEATELSQAITMAIRPIMELYCRNYKLREIGAVAATAVLEIMAMLITLERKNKV